MACSNSILPSYSPAQIRQHNDHVTAAMRGWENAFVSQQQMLASHTAILRNMERRTHHNPWHHIQFAHQLFWDPYLWNNHVSRFPVCFYKPTRFAAYLLPHPCRSPSFFFFMSNRGSVGSGLFLHLPASWLFISCLSYCQCWS